jgi:phospholipase C
VSRHVFAWFSVLLLAAGALLLSLNGCAGTSSSGGGHPPGKIEHVVVIFQENRTPDNLFHDPVLIGRGADIASSGINSSHQTVPLTAEPLGINYDLGHGHSDFVVMYDGGAMDGADKIKVTCEGTPCPPPNPQFYYVQASDVAPYFQMAETYTFGDHMFQTNEGPSFPAHQFIISGTSAPTATSTMFVSSNPAGVSNSDNDTGCTAPPAEYVWLIDANGDDSTQAYPCTEHPALTDELDAKGISWRYYTPSAGSIWTGPNAIQHLCGPNAPPPNATACQSADWNNDVILYTNGNPAPILTDISNNNLPAVSWVIPSGQNSDHPGATDATGGPSWVASIVNAIGTSSYWSNTAIIVTWDDWGGWYDHVPPPQVINNGTSWGSGYVYGFRVPLIVISPYAKAGYISHVNHDFGSILHFIEQVYGLSSLGYADAHADDLSDCFDLNQSPISFETIDAPMKADHFLNDHRPPTAPDND